MIVGIIEAIKSFIITYPWLVGFIGSFIGGNEYLTVLTFGAAQGYYGPVAVFIACYIGMVLSDFFWYFVGRYRLLKFLRKIHVINLSAGALEKWFDSFKIKPFYLIQIASFMYGVGFLAFVYLGRKKFPFSKLLYYDLVAKAVWALFYFCIGWFAGKGFALFVVAYDNLNLIMVTLTFLVALLLLINYLLKMTIEKYVFHIKKNGKKK